MIPKEGLSNGFPIHELYRKKTATNLLFMKGETKWNWFLEFETPALKKSPNFKNLDLCFALLKKNWKSCRMTLFLSQGDKDQFNFAPNFSFNSCFSFHLCSSIYKLSHFHLKLYSICHLKHCINFFYLSSFLCHSFSLYFFLSFFLFHFFLSFLIVTFLVVSFLVLWISP